MSLLRLNLGCGSHTIKGAVNVDRVAAPGVDQVHDLDTPWPWQDGCAGRIDAKDVFEHVAEPVLFMTEAHRVLCDGGTLFIRTPHWQHQDAYTDPTHRRFPTEYTFDFWIAGTVLHRLHNAFYGAVSFQRIAMEMDNGSMIVLLTKIGANSDAGNRRAIDQQREIVLPVQLGSGADRRVAAGDAGTRQADGVLPGADHLPATVAC